MGRSFIRHAWPILLLGCIACVSGQMHPPHCEAPEQPVVTSSVFDHEVSVPAGKTWSCEAPCAPGQKRALVYEDGQPELKLFVFNGQLQQIYEHACVPECAAGEQMDRHAVSSGSGTRYSYTCYNIAKREGQQKVAQEADAQKERAWRDAHPEEARMKDCINRCMVDIRNQCSSGNQSTDLSGSSSGYSYKMPCCQGMCEHGGDVETRETRQQPANASEGYVCMQSCHRCIESCSHVPGHEDSVVSLGCTQQCATVAHMCCRQAGYTNSSGSSCDGC